jgi:MoaA/NifB/PqqE/SkfB family radical SAM enzyme
MPNFYCAAPWRGLHINPRGDVKTCCAGDPNMLGNLNSQTIENILNGPQLQEIRTSLAQGKAHDYCINCVRAERFGADGERAWHNRINPDFDYTTAGTQYHWPTIIDVRWNTTCNLSCNYCGSACSSKWAALQSVPFRSGTRPYYQQVCDFIKKHFDHVHEVALVGGEPLLLPENERLLDVIPQDATITLITNLSLDLENNKIFRKLSQRKKVGWSMSFDNIGSRFEYVRHGAQWTVLENNLNIIGELKLNQGHWGGIHAVYNLYNATRIRELRQFADQQGLTVLWQNLFTPSYLDPFVHGESLAKLAIVEIENFYKEGNPTDNERAFFNHAMQKYQCITDPATSITAQFKKHNEQIENLYHPDQQGQFAKLWPELEYLCH